jgi:UDP-N-acetyl-D-mannosaminuronate dehydrogenase
VPKAIRIFEPNLSQGAQFEEDLINTSLETTLDGADIVILAMNHTYFETHRQRILGLCRPDTWFADVWNISRLNKIFFQTMEVAV